MEDESGLENTHQRRDDPNAGGRVAANTCLYPIPNAGSGMEDWRDPWPVLVRQPSNSAFTPVSYVLSQTSLAFLSCMGLVEALPGNGFSLRW